MGKKALVLNSDWQLIERSLREELGYSPVWIKDDKEGGQMPLPENTFTIAKLMKSVGYKTALVGKWGLGMNNTTGDPNLHGFDYYYGFLDQKQAHNLYPTHLWENGKWDTLRNTYQLVHEYQNKKVRKAMVITM